jgi:DNA mismatch endonuclease, patch repair protein
MRGLKTPQERSALMRRVRQRGTAPELTVQTLVRRMGYRFKTNGTHLPGSPDLYNTRSRRAVFVHGCFWHRHTGCKAATTPKNNAAFWQAKFESNMERDRMKQRQLRQLGYRVLTIWSCQLEDAAKLARLKRRMERFLQP